jgi:hypothetical protein
MCQNSVKELVMKEPGLPLRIAYYHVGQLDIGPSHTGTPLLVSPLFSDLKS